MIVGRIDGGTNTNVVPGKVVFKMDRRLVPEEDIVQVEADVRSMIEHAASSLPGIKVEIKRLLLARPFFPLAGQEKLVSATVKLKSMLELNRISDGTTECY